MTKRFNLVDNSAPTSTVYFGGSTMSVSCFCSGTSPDGATSTFGRPEISFVELFRLLRISAFTSSVLTLALAWLMRILMLGFDWNQYTFSPMLLEYR